MPWKLCRNKNGSICKFIYGVIDYYIPHCDKFYFFYILLSLDYFNPITKVTSWEPPSIVAKSVIEEKKEEVIVNITTNESKEDSESNINKETKKDCTNISDQIIESSIIENKIIESLNPVINEVKENSDINRSTPCNSEIIQSEVSNDSSVKSESKLFKPKASGLKALLSKLSFAK